MSGWKIDRSKYKETEALFKSIWETLEVLGDINKDGKITRTEWVRCQNVVDVWFLIVYIYIYI